MTFLSVRCLIIFLMTPGAGADKNGRNPNTPTLPRKVKQCEKSYGCCVDATYADTSFARWYQRRALSADAHGIPLRIRYATVPSRNEARGRGGRPCLPASFAARRTAFFSPPDDAGMPECRGNPPGYRPSAPPPPPRPRCATARYAPAGCSRRTPAYCRCRCA